MLRHLKRRLLLGALLTLQVAFVSAESPSLQTSIEQIWNEEIGDIGRIVVERRGVPFKNSKGKSYLIHSTVVWSWRKDDGSDEKVLFRRLGDFAGITGLEPEDKPVTVLFTAWKNGKLLTVFNQNGTVDDGEEKCWAFIVEPKADGTFVQIPGDRDSPPPTNGPTATNAVGPALKTAKIELGANGTANLSGTDQHDHPVRFVLDSWELRHADKTYEMKYWRDVTNSSSTTSPTFRPAAQATSRPAPTTAP